MSNKKGDLGEKLAQKELKKNGHKILCRNFSVHDIGEIDIISRQGREIVFSEVKTRNINYFYEPVYAVDFRKQGRIIRTAQCYLMKNKISLQPRFDIIEVIMRENELVSINIIENAFGV